MRRAGLLLPSARLREPAAEGRRLWGASENTSTASRPVGTICWALMEAGVPPTPLRPFHRGRLRLREEGLVQGVCAQLLPPPPPPPRPGQRPGLPQSSQLTTRDADEILA